MKLIKKKHSWDILEDIVVCSHVLYGDITDKKVIKALCKEFDISPSQLSARANNYKYLLGHRKSFWKTSFQEREVYRVLDKHDTVVL